MYSTCLYCTKDLGSNDVLETLPIGRRVAFDAAQGRLWVVCRSCAKWNLVPFDTRLETIDACERLFRDTRMRYSTDNIGIARLPEGLELVRVGRAQRPEFAAWRYGDQFGRRRILTGVKIGAAVVGAGVFLVGGHALRAVGVPMVLGPNLPNFFNFGVTTFQRNRVAVRHPGPPGVGGVMTRFDIRKSVIQWDGDGRWWTRIPLRRMVRGPFVGPLNRPVGTDVHPDATAAALGRIMPRINGSGGSKQQVLDAVELVGTEGALDSLIRRAVGRKPERVFNSAVRVSTSMGFDGELALKSLNQSVRLAIEMSAHEDTERQALRGELRLLERQWKEAEELARIADSLAVPDEIADDPRLRHGNREDDSTLSP